MSLLLKLPESLVNALLVEWLHLSSIANLDTAHCHHQYRTAFCTVAYNSSTVYIHTPFYASSPSSHMYTCVEWLILRKIMVNYVTICIQLRNDWRPWKVYLSITGHYLHTICFVVDECFPLDISDELLHFVVKNCGPNLTTFSMHNCSIRTYSNFERLLIKCTSITSINISLGEHLHPARTFYLIADNCPQLSALELTHTKMDEGAFIAVLQSCAELTTLRLIASDHTSINVTALAKIAQYCPHLQTLHLKQRIVTDTTVSLIAQHCLDLTDIALISQTYTDAALQAVARCCGKLRKLKFALNTHISDATLLAVGTHCTELVELHVDSPYGAPERNLTETGWESILKNCRKLTRVVRPEDL